jgi:hypothetical protein
LKPGGFTALTPDDELFRLDDFLDTSYARVRQLLAPFPFAHVHRGFFPAAAENLNLGPIALCHLDVDVYLATSESLAWLRTPPRPPQAPSSSTTSTAAAAASTALSPSSPPPSPSSSSSPCSPARDCSSTGTSGKPP